MRKLALALAVLAGLLPAVPARAEIGIPDVVPAATLLLPYFEVDLADLGGPTTLFSVNNASDEPVLAQVTIWSEWWVPILGFTVYLTGYDVQTINLRDIVVHGDLPNTGPSNALSSLGPFSLGPHASFGGTCSAAAGSVPNYANLAAAFLQVVQQSLSGQPRHTDGLCTARPGRPALARGFVTVDVVTACADEFPTAPGYFVQGGAGTAGNANVLWGDYFLVDPGRNFAQGFPLVHLEADADSLGVLDGACDEADRGPTTFYCTLRNPAFVPGEDNREGLPSVYATRYAVAGFDGGSFPPGSREQGTGAGGSPPGGVAHADLPRAGSARPPAVAAPAVEGTDLLVWRDKNGTGAGEPRACDDPPPPLGQVQIVAFDEEENPLVQASGPEGGPFPVAAQRARVGTDVTVGAGAGWLFLNLNGGRPPPQEPFRQAFVSVVISAEGRFSVGYEGIALNALTLDTDNRRGPRNPNPTLGVPPHPGGPTLFGP
jgi:hypothetical protein